MPELPDVEATRRYLLNAGIVGRTFAEVRLDWPRAVKHPDPQSFLRGLRDRTVEDIGRRAKYLLVRLDGPTLIIHLRMTGSLVLAPPGEPPDRLVRTTFLLRDGGELRFRDPRKLGMMWLVDDPSPVLFHLGPEPLDPAFTPQALRQRLDRKAPVKALLLEQDVVAGVGNIYADEVLWCARLHPQHPGHSLTDAEAKRLHGCLVIVLSEATEELVRLLPLEGPPSETEDGSSVLQVPRTEDAPCPRCGAPVRRTRIRGRSSYFCLRCQR